MKIIRAYLLLYISSKILNSSKYTLLKLSKTTSPEELFPSDCITLYSALPIFVYFNQNLEYDDKWFNLTIHLQCVVQSDENHFGGDVVLDSFNKAFWDDEKY